MASIKLNLEILTCIDLQETKEDEIIFWGVMVTNEGLYITLPKFKKMDFKRGVYHYLPPGLSTLSLSINPNKTFVAKAAIWMIEIDKYVKLFDNDWKILFDEFVRLYTEKRNQYGGTKNILAFQQVLPKLNDFILKHSKYQEGMFMQSNEVYNYLQLEYVNSNFPITSSGEVFSTGTFIERPDSLYHLGFKWSIDLLNG